jgi:hypothetical protein
MGIYSPSVAALTNPIKFSVSKTAATQTINTGADTKITFTTEDYDTGGNFDNVTNFNFTAPVAGFYRFTASAGYNAVASGSRLYISLFKGGVENKRGDDRFTNALSGNAVVTATIQLAANDTVDVRGQPVGANTVINNTASRTWFQGELLSLT